MIKLPDFSHCVEIQQLLFDMGVKHIENLPDIKFTRKIEKKVVVTVKNTDQLLYAKKLKIEAIPLGTGEIFISNNGIIEVNGLKACIYIKDQRTVYTNDGTSSYRFHLCWCNTIESMAHSGRKSRYVATARDDGFFPVNFQLYNTYDERLVKLKLCKKCKHMLIERKMYFSHLALTNFIKNIRQIYLIHLHVRKPIFLKSNMHQIIMR